VTLPYSFQQYLLIAAGIAWAIVIYKTHVLFDGDRSARTTWFGFLFLMIYQTTSISQVRAYVDSVAPNLSWLLAYSAAMISLYHIALTGYAILVVPIPRWVRPMLIVALAAFAAIYLTSIAGTPNYYDRTVPRSVHDLVFVNTALFYDMLLCSVALLLFLRLCRQRGGVATRLRWGVVCGALAVTDLYLAAKAAASTMSFYHLPGLSLARELLGVRPLVWLMWPLALLTNRHYLVLLSPFLFVDRLLTFVRLRVIEAKLSSLLCRLEVADSARRMPFLRCLTNLSFYTHWTFLSILDGNLLLKTAEPGISNATLLTEALRFRQVLARIPSDTAIALPTVYKHTARLAREL
jgi:hypothetical protein